MFKEKVTVLEKAKTWLTAIRAESFLTTLTSTGVGTALAFNEGYFNPFLLIMTLCPLLLIHTGTNLTNDYYDYKIGLDNSEGIDSSGLSLVKGLITPEQINQIAIASFLVSIPFGIYLTILRGPIIFILGTLGAMAGYFYTATPINYKYHGLGGLSIFTFMGLIIVWGSYYIQTGILNYYPLLVALPVSFLIAGMQHSNELRDYENDKKTGIHTAPVLMGFTSARYYYYFLIVSAYLSLGLLIFYKLLPIWTALAFITLPLAFTTIRTVHQAETQDELYGIVAQAATLIIEVGGILTITLIISTYL